MNITNRLYLTDRKEWHRWLADNFTTEKEVWLVYPNKKTGMPRISYNDAVEEALCYGWIDSTVKSLKEGYAAQRFTPRNSKSTYSQSNIERLKWLSKHKLLDPSVEKNVHEFIHKEFIFPEDIMDALKEDAETWKNFQGFTDSYKRIRIAYIVGAGDRSEEFRKRLANFIHKTKANKLMTGFGGIDKYY